MKKEKKNNNSRKVLIMAGGTLLSIAGLILIPVLSEKFGAWKDEEECCSDKIEADDIAMTE